MEGFFLAEEDDPRIIIIKIILDVIELKLHLSKVPTNRIETTDARQPDK